MCNHCKANVERNLSKIEGVTGVTVNLEQGIAYVEGSFDAGLVISCIENLGYEYIRE